MGKLKINNLVTLTLDKSATESEVAVEYKHIHLSPSGIKLEFVIVSMGPSSP